MKTTGAYKIWQIIYPIGIYYVVSGIVYMVLEVLLGPAGPDYMLRQMICAAATLPFLWSFYKEDKKTLPAGPGRGDPQPPKETGNLTSRGSGAGRDVFLGRKGMRCRMSLLSDLALSAIAGGTAGIALNNLIAMTRLTQMSSGFKEANEAFFAGQLIFELLGSCLLIPVAEELLYRGVVYRRMRPVCGASFSVLLSAVIFGLMHGNLVQFLYAGALGLLLAFLLERTKHLLTAVCAHIAANLAAVLRQETGWLSFCYEVSPAALLCTAVLTAAAAAAVLILWKKRR